MGGVESVSLLLAFSAGVFSFVSPCVLPLVPSYVSYVTGLSLEAITANEDGARGRATKNSLLFILGFSVIFIAFGASATAVGRFFLTYQAVIRQVGGLIIILFGLYVLGIIKPILLMRDFRFRHQDGATGYVGSFFAGVIFGSGWTPCVGPILGSILLYAATTDSVFTGMQLLSVYSLGLGVPLFLSALGMQSFLVHYRRHAQWMHLISKISGVFLVGVGALLATNAFIRLTSFLSQIGVGWSIGQ